MSFNSAQFFIFWFVIQFSILIWNGKALIRNLVLLIGNLVFLYSLGSYQLALLVLGFSSMDFFIAQKIHKDSSESIKKILLRFSVVQNIALILLFRHFSDWNLKPEFIDFIKFIGVSFYAFRSMSYVFDVYYETIEVPENSIINYWTYISFFPIFLMGPIQTSPSFLKHLHSPSWVINKTQVNWGAYLISLGIVKKFILSNYLAVNFVDRIFDSYLYFTPMENFFAAIIQTLNLYLDFSGYTDIAIGISMLLGFQIIENFNFPFLSQNITEYWKRWHISLSQWFNQYLYFPLSYQMRKWKKWGTSIAVLIVFIISGVWHGTQLNFLLWGLMHALALIWDIWSSDLRFKLKSKVSEVIYKPISIFLTFSFLTFSGIYFKATEIDAANGMIQRIFNGLEFSLFNDWLNLYPYVALIFSLSLLIHFTISKFYLRIIETIKKLPVLVSAIMLVVVIFIAFQFQKMGSVPFYYLEF